MGEREISLRELIVSYKFVLVSVTFCAIFFEKNQLMACGEYHPTHWKKKLYKDMDICTGCRDITEAMLKTA